MFYVYILYSKIFDKYYVGHTNNPEQRLISHNTSEKNTYTSKYRPWIMVKLIEVPAGRGEAMKVEKFIKKQKSISFIKKIIEHGWNDIHQ